MRTSISSICDLKGVGLTVEEAEVMRVCVALSSDVWTGYVDGKVACTWGVVPPSLLSETAYLWLYTTDIIEEHKFAFVRHSQVQIQRLLEVYKTIHGHCVLGSASSIRWLKWLGATFGEPDGKLIPFQIRKKDG
jgi:hypothetical protein